MRYEGLSGWVSDLRKEIAAVTVGVPGGGRDLTDRAVDLLHTRYIYLVKKGYRVPSFALAAGDEAARKMLLQLKADTGLASPVVFAFMRALYTLTRAGKIDAIKYDPVSVADARKARAESDPSVLDRLSKTAGAAAGSIGKLGIGLVAVAALGAAVYFKLGRK